MYRWVVLVHVLGAFGFLIVHGISTAVVLQLRNERDMERVKALLELSQRSLIWMYVFVLILLGSGIIAGFMLNWWGQWWIWVSTAILIVVSVVMYPLGSLALGRVRKVAGLPYAEGRVYDNPALPPGTSEELAAAIDTLRPWELLGIGVAGIVIITWLMMFKPF